MEQFWSSSTSWCEQQQCALSTLPATRTSRPQQQSQQQLEELRQWNHQLAGDAEQLQDDYRETARAYQIRLHPQVDADGDGQVLLPTVLARVLAALCCCERLGAAGCCPCAAGLCWVPRVVAGCPVCCAIPVGSQEFVVLGSGCWQVSSQEFVAAVLGGSVGRGLQLDAHVQSYQKSAVQSAIVTASYWLEEAGDQPTSLYLVALMLLGLMLLGCSQQGSSICKALGSRITYAIPVNRSLLHNLRSI